MIEKQLSPKQQRFVEEYIKSNNATEAAMLAGYSSSSTATAQVQGSRLLSNAMVLEAINAHFDDIHQHQKRVLVKAANSAIKALIDTVKNGRGLARVQAANSILDRAGHKPVDYVNSKVDANVTGTMDVVDARQQLLEKFNRRYPAAITSGENPKPKR